MKVLSRLLLLAMLVASLGLAGCDDGDNGDPGAPGASAYEIAVANGFTGTEAEWLASLEAAPPAGEYVGLVNCSTCHGTSTAVADWKTSAHANQGDGTVDACATVCHNPLGDSFDAQAAFGISSPNVVGCESCHGPGSGHVGVGPIPVPAPGTAVCAQCHDGAEHLASYPFYANIASRFNTSRHANQSARAGLCSACHSHEGGIEFLAMGRLTDGQAQLEETYNAVTASAYSLPVGSDTIVGVMKKNCATCHDPHTTALRGDGEIVATSTNVTDFPVQATPAPIDGEIRVAYSAEFNLCTACHTVDLDATWDATEGYSGRGMITYELSEKYTSAYLKPAAATTFDLTKAPFYHDGDSGNGRTFVDTHFGGTIMKHLVDFSGEATDITIKGYNINPGNKNACTICHDPHTAGKLLSIDSSSTVDYADQLDNQAVSYAEGLGDFHTNYLGDAFSRNQNGCAPCHTGNSFVKLTVGGTASAERWNVVGCRACHDLAVPNATANVNNSAAFAEVREFPADYQFKFNAAAAAVVPAADLGVNQICFECHKGRTPGVDVAALPDPAAGTRNYDISYLHYAPSMAILFGNDSKMVATYPGKTYAGRFTHYDGAKFGCVDCHDVHNTEGNHVVSNKMQNPAFDCNGCHGTAAFVDAAVLQARTQAFSERLLDEIMIDMVAADGQVGMNAVLQSKITALMGAYPNANFATAEEELMDYIQQRQVYFPNKTIAHAATTWKVFTYEDGAPHGQTHGHGGSWAHNSKFARQMMFDAIESLGGSTVGLTRP